MATKNSNLIKLEQKHWRSIIAKREGDYGTWNSPLCKEYWSKKECVGCPIQIKTGKIDCEDTPYEKFYTHMLDKHPTDWAKDEETKIICPECKELAEKHLDFLNSLVEG